MDISSAPVIAALEERSRHALLDRAVPRNLDVEDTLHFAGERPDRVHVIESGIFKLVARDGSGNETILGLATAGEVVGALTVVDGFGQPIDVIAASACTVIGIDAGNFATAVTSCPRAITELLIQTQAQLRWVYATTLERSAGEIPARLAGRLLDLADILGKPSDGTLELDVPLRQTDLGRLAGMSRESTCKTLRRFKAAGVLDYRGRRLRILRPDVLERIRCAGRA